jgi:hypothetical protein
MPRMVDVHPVINLCMKISLPELLTRRAWRQMLPFVVPAGTPILCLSDGMAGMILAVTEIGTKRAYLVQPIRGAARIILATEIDAPALTL